jgi:hypothetical protein
MTGAPLLATVEPSMLMFCDTQAVFPFDAPVACCVIEAVDDAVCVKPEVFAAFS